MIMDSYLKELQTNWDGLGKADPLFAILTDMKKKGNKWDATEFFKTGDDEIARILKQLTKLKVKVNQNKALDFGCGVGRLTQSLSKYFDVVYGIDIASSMLALAKKYNYMYNGSRADKCQFILKESVLLDKFEDNTIDFIISMITLQHIKPEYAKEYVGEFLRVLKPNGIAVFHIPDELMMFNGEEFVNDVEYFDDYMVDGRMKELVVEMHGIAKEEIIKLVKNNGGKLLDAQVHDAKEKMVGYNYFVMKL